MTDKTPDPPADSRDADSGNRERPRKEIPPATIRPNRFARLLVPALVGPTIALASAVAPAAVAAPIADASATDEGEEREKRQHVHAPSYQGELPTSFFIVDARPPEDVFRDGFVLHGPRGDLLRHAWVPPGAPHGPFRNAPQGFIRAAGTAQGAHVLLGQQWPRWPWIYEVAPGPDFHQLRQSMRAVADNAWARAADALCHGDTEAHLDWARYAEMSEEWLRRQEHVAGRIDEWVGTDMIPPERVQAARPVQWDEALRREVLGPTVHNLPAPGRPGADPGLMSLPASRELYTGLPSQAEARITGSVVQFPAIGGPPDIEAPGGRHLP